MPSVLKLFHFSPKRLIPSYLSTTCSLPPLPPILFHFLTPLLHAQHQQQVAAAVERAKQVTTSELNAIIGVSMELIYTYTVVTNTYI